MRYYHPVSADLCPCCSESDFLSMIGVVTNSSGFSGDILYFEYVWASDSVPPALGTLNAVLVGEHVQYPGTSALFQYPSPPFGPAWAVPNPTVLNPVWGSVGKMADEIKWFNSWSPPYVAKTVDATQNLRYHCNRCSTKSDSKQLDWGTVVSGPISISGIVEDVPPGSTNWQYRATKSSLSTLPVKLP
jgi:hypothetical protein